VHLPAEGSPVDTQLGPCPACDHPTNTWVAETRLRCAHCSYEWDTDEDPALPGLNLPDCPTCGFHRSVPITGGWWRCARWNCRHEYHPRDISEGIPEAEAALARGDVTPLHWTGRIPDDVNVVHTTDGIRWFRCGTDQAGDPVWKRSGHPSVGYTERGLLNRYGSVYDHPVDVDGTPLAVADMDPPAYYTDSIPRTRTVVWTADGQEWLRDVGGAWVSASGGQIRFEKELLELYGAVYPHRRIEQDTRPGPDAGRPNDSLRAVLAQAQAALVDCRTQYQLVLSDTIAVINDAVSEVRPVAAKYLSTSKAINAENYRALNRAVDALTKTTDRLQSLLPDPGSDEK
jgi:hypothetical protein